MKNLLRGSFITLLIAIVTGGAAQAHTGLGTVDGFASGAVHPFLGLDHILAMVGVGLWAAMLGGRNTICVPLAFVAAMIIGGAVGIAGIEFPLVELGIVSSLIVIGGLISLRTILPLPVAMSIVSLFALFHGHAHGAEMPASVSGLLYGLGFVVATVTLHATGIGLGRLLRTTAATRYARLTGLGIAGSGLALLVIG